MITSERKNIAVCICTYKRPLLLRRLLQCLKDQQTHELFTFSIVIADNDQSESAKQVVDDFMAESSIQVVYCVEPRQNIALARNKSIENAKGDFIAFIDDDEFPTGEWLWNLYTACTSHDVAGVLGPVKPSFEHEPAQWILKGKFFERPKHNTGYRMGMWECRTGNILFVRTMLDDVREPFRSEFGTCGEDTDFFCRMINKGFVFIWCNEAVVYEVVPPERCNRRYLLRKGLLRGSNFLKHPVKRGLNLLKSFVAVPIYVVLLPVLFLAGHHHFMKYLVKLCDHTSRLFMLLGIQLVRKRDA